MKKGKFYFLALFGFIFINYLIYLRLVKVRLPKELTQELFNCGDFFTLGIFCLLMLLSAFLVLLNLRKILGKNAKFKENWFTKLLVVFSNFQKNSYLAVDHIIKEVILYDYIGEILTSFGNYLYRNFSENQQYFLILFYILPRIFVMVFLLFDVFYFKKLDYVYKFSFLLLFPLIVDYLMNSLNKFWKDNAKIFGEVLYFYNYKTEERIMVDDLIFAQLGFPSFKHLVNSDDVISSLSQEFLEEHQNELFDVELTLQDYLDNFKEIVIPCALFEIKFSMFYKEKLLPYFLVIFHTFYVFIWGYLLFYSW